MRPTIKRILFIFIKPLVFGYLSKPRMSRQKGFSLKILPGVFHPKFYISTSILLDFLETLDVLNRQFLELGAGSGAVGFYAEKKGAIVTLSDISQLAINGLKHNRDALKSSALVVQSDLFEALQAVRFDCIFINPPYYPEEVGSEEEYAWFCGKNHEYFQRLFAQLPNHLADGSQVFMILSEDCDLERIGQLAREHDFGMEMVVKKRKWWEWNYVFEVTHARF